MNNENSEDKSSELQTENNIATYLDFGFKNRKFIIWITLASIVSSIAFALLQDKYYSAKVVMIEADQTNSGLSAFSNISQSFGGITSLIGGFSPEDSNTTKALAILESRTFLEEFIYENDILKIILSDDWDNETQSWIDDEKDLFDGYMELRNQISVSKDNKSNTFSISVEWKDPRLSANWANLLFKKINLFMSNKDRLSAERNIAYLEAQVQTSEKVSLQNTLFAMIEQQSKTKMLANAQEEYIFEAIDMATVPKERSKPQRRLIVMAGTILGFLSSIAIIFIKEYLLYIKRIYSKLS